MSSCSDFSKPNNSRHLSRGPDFVPREIPNPDAKVGGIGGEAHPLFALAQGPLGQPAAAELNDQRANQECLQGAQEPAPRISL